MKSILSLLSYVFFLNFAHAADIAPQSIFGEYENEHQIPFICFDEKNGECFCPDGKKEDEYGHCYAITVDKLLIKNIKNKSKYGQVHLNIQAVGTNFHTCDFDGNGDWEEYNDRLLVSGEEIEDGDRCEVILFFKENKAHIVTRPLGGICSYYCGVSTGLDGLVFQKKLTSQPSKR